MILIGLFVGLFLLVVMASKLEEKLEKLLAEYADGLDREEIENILTVGSNEYGSPVVTENENGVVAILKFLISQGCFEKTFNLKPIAHIEWEFPVPRGRADFVLFHVDGSITVLEAKGSVDDRGLLNAIGQVMAYSVQIGYAKTAKEIRKMIVAARTGSSTAHLKPIFDEAGIDFHPLGKLKNYRKEVVQMVLKLLAAENCDD